VLKKVFLNHIFLSADYDYLCSIGEMLYSMYFPVYSMSFRCNSFRPWNVDRQYVAVDVSCLMFLCRPSCD